MRAKLALLLLTLFSFSCYANEASTQKYLESIQDDPQALITFFWHMPKGADLHNHLSGAVYSENLLVYGRHDHLCIDDKTLTASVNANCDATHQLDHLDIMNPLYQRILDAWSMDNFKADKETAHDHFFATFMKFGPIPDNHTPELLTEVSERAGNQNESYLELMITADGNRSGKLGAKVGWDKNLAILRMRLLNAGLLDIVNDMSTKIRADEATRDAIMVCHTTLFNPGCDIEIRYLYQVLREQAPEKVFAQLLAGFELANRDPKFVGINMVQPEDGPISMRDYHLHMQMVGFLHQIYPKVHISLHAGELTSDLVPADGLRFHIREAIEIAHAERIGHGVDITHEDNAADLLREMADKQIYVEINLTSNQQILNVSGAEHPLPLYLQNHVPVGLSTDDEGVERTDLSSQYEMAEKEYHYTYAQLKAFAYASLQHSFVDEETKKKLLQDLDQRFRKFEALH